MLQPFFRQRPSPKSMKPLSFQIEQLMIDGGDNGDRGDRDARGDGGDGG